MAQKFLQFWNLVVSISSDLSMQMSTSWVGKIDKVGVGSTLFIKVQNCLISQSWKYLHSWIRGGFEKREKQVDRDLEAAFSEVVPKNCT